MTPAFSSFADFLAMGGYAFYVWLSLATTLVVLLGLVGYSLWQHHALLQAVRRQQRREQRLRHASEHMKKEQADAGTP